MTAEVELAPRKSDKSEILIGLRHGLTMELGDICHYRELDYLLALHDIKESHKQTTLGAAYTLLS